MPAEGSYQASTYNLELDAEIQRLKAQVVLSWEKEARTLKWFGLADGMNVLEAGSGPGFFTEQLLKLLPNSLLTAVEIDPVLHEKALGYLQDKGGDRVNRIQASIADTGLEDNTFDFAIARLLFVHLPDPVAAAREIFRILKPSGKLVIIDSDADLFWLTNPPWSVEIVREKFKQVMASRGGNLCVGRNLCRILKEAKFGNVDLEAVVSHSDIIGIQAFEPLLDSGPILQMVKQGLISESEIESYLIYRDEFAAAGDRSMMSFWLMACGKKLNRYLP
ncbi:class I SAM-dependent methyltransferase [Microcoleus sp. PH2017_05_CCC_O_A]|uniref:class I SAM-dependent methyltransferase n=1 Tax=Microcoleus sp. PH2017_05_CCC_O_A TaxID=2798816 RepID=UPI001D1C71FA|nr:class I SAM-dependent methyltransferase [Microcoleus sp. PH2017_05_CCC_O_A]MCC3436586.1 methyltransferase domain-containing protein [Microcoleus sp. PH2017_05_CCC_O_A]TAG04294.1 MAG: SAM-dependent methyltransferase [Oscillatoriales cyanobacterium]TAG58166.1 MAG: SAM-dependent methyltransferase [Oscillatoriales cyanobacterium]